jgi:hypothetical protein
MGVRGLSQIGTLAIVASQDVTREAQAVTGISAPPDIGRPPLRGTFVQTDRATHEAWAKFSIKRPAASAVLHYLAANVGYHNAVIIPQKTVAKALGISDRTVRRAVDDLETGNWLQVVKLGAGRECAYVLNDRVVWADKRDNLRLSRFSAEVIADADDQAPHTLSDAPLHRLPSIFSDEAQLPSGEGLPPVSQPFFDGMEPDLPATVASRDRNKNA